MKNRTIIGIICIVLALVVTFAVAPLVNKLADNRTDIVRLTGDVVQGHMISDTDIEVVTARIIGIPPPPLASKRYLEPCFRASARSSGPKSATTALLDVTTFFPALSAAIEKSYAG